MKTNTKRELTTLQIVVLFIAIGIGLFRYWVESGEDWQINQEQIEPSESERSFTNRFLVELPVENSNMQFDNITSQLIEMGFKKKQSKKITEALKKKIAFADADGQLEILWVKYFCERRIGNSTKTRILEFAIDIDGNIEIVEHFNDNLETFIEEDPRIEKVQGNWAVNFERCCLKEINDEFYFDCEGRLVYVTEALYKRVLRKFCEISSCL